MTDPRLEVTLSQIGDAIHKMREFAEGMTFEDYQRDAKTRFAMERCVEIISEAVRRIPLRLQQRHADIPWNDIRG